MAGKQSSKAAYRGNPLVEDDVEDTLTNCRNVVLFLRSVASTGEIAHEDNEGLYHCLNMVEGALMYATHQSTRKEA